MVSRFLSLSPSLSPLFFLSGLFQRTPLASDHFPQNKRGLSLFLSPGGYCPAGSSVVTSCPAGVIDWLLCLLVLVSPTPRSHVLLVRASFLPCTTCKRLFLSRQDKTRQGKTRQDKTRQDKTRQARTRQDKTRRDMTRQDKARKHMTRQENRRHQDKTRQEMTREMNGSDGISTEDTRRRSWGKTGTG